MEVAPTVEYVDGDAYPWKVKAGVGGSSLQSQHRTKRQAKKSAKQYARKVDVRTIKVKHKSGGSERQQV